LGDPDELKKVLVRTLGVPLFQEQAMRVANVAAGFTPGEADQLRRAMATFKHTQGVGVYHERLVGGMVSRGYDPEMAERVFKQIEGFGSYGFPESHAASFAHLAYASSWLKCHHPAVFAAALLNSQPMGFYAPAQIVGDAQKHGVEVRPVDINASDWDSTLELEMRSADQHALRLGLRLASGLAEEDGRLIAKVRRSGNGSPYGSVEDVARRTGISRKAIEALAEADAFASLGASRRSAIWDAKAIERGVPPLLRLAENALGEAGLINEVAPLLPAEAAGQAVVQDYSATGLTLRQHPLALLRPVLSQQGYHDTRRLNTARPGSAIRLPGIVLMRQRPGTAKGIVFITLEDEFGVANLVIFPNIGERDRAAMIGARLMLAEGRIERETEHAEVPITHLICRKLIDRGDLLRQLSISDNDPIWTDAALGHADEVRRPNPGSTHAKAGLPASRDFR
jgi:error-prone DNA polymerase